MWSEGDIFCEVQQCRIRIFDWELSSLGFRFDIDAICLTCYIPGWLVEASRWIPVVSREISPIPTTSVRCGGSTSVFVKPSVMTCIWVDEYIGPDNGYQPYYPTVVLEPRYVGPVIEGIREYGLDLAVRG